MTNVAPQEERKQGAVPDRNAILLTSPALAFLEPELDEEYEVLKSWDAPPRQALDSVKAIVCMGHQSQKTHVDNLPSLELVACFTTGYDALDKAELHRRGIAVSHAPGVTAYAVAEFALAQILSVLRGVAEGDRLIRSGAWNEGTFARISPSLRASTVGIVGLGAIGETLANLLTPFGTEIAWWGPRPKPVSWRFVPSLEELAATSDILVVCAKAEESNRGLISRAIIEALGPGGLLVNVARGQLVDEDELIEALRDGRLGGAALDVFQQEPTTWDRWKNVPNVLVTPHIGGASIESKDRMTALLKCNLDSFFQTGTLATPIPAQAQKEGRDKFDGTGAACAAGQQDAN